MSTGQETRPAKSRLMARVAPVVALGMAALAVWIFAKTLGRYDASEVFRRFSEIPAHRAAIALVCVAASYLLQAAYDYLALASLGRGASLRRALFAAFIGNAFTNNIGMSALTGPSIRFRFYSAWGYSTFEIAQVIALTKLAFLNGLFTMAGLALLVDPVPIPEQWGGFPARAAGALLLLPAAATLLWNGLGRGSHLSFGRLRMARPRQSLLLLQIGVSCLHLALAAFTLYALVPASALAGAGFGNPLGFLSSFMAVKVAAMFVPVPGSLGVFEGAAVTLLTPALPDYPLLGGLLAYRLFYYVVPFAVAVAGMLAYEVGSKSGVAARWLRRKRVPA